FSRMSGGRLRSLSVPVAKSTRPLQTLRKSQLMPSWSAPACVEVGKYRAFSGNAVDVGRAIAHHAPIVGADIPVADVITEDDKDIRLAPGSCACAVWADVCSADAAASVVPARRMLRRFNFERAY